jgi:hypothetical protein
LMNENTPQPHGLNEYELVLVYAASYDLREEFGLHLRQLSDITTNASFRHARYTEMASARGYVRPTLACPHNLLFAYTLVPFNSDTNTQVFPKPCPLFLKMQGS